MRKQRRDGVVVVVPWGVWAIAATVCVLVSVGRLAMYGLHEGAVWTVALALVGTMFGMWALRSYFHVVRRRELLERARSLHHLRTMNWREFELLVGEAYRRHGYKVREVGQGGADGGVDLVLTRGSKRGVVQCKHWRSNRIGVAVVRELVGVMMHERAAFGKLVCSGTFTRDAWNFVQGKPVELVDGKRLLELVESP